MKTSNIQKAVIKLLKENTGVHFLDSGFDNGRMWQRNQNKNFLNEPRVDNEGTVSVFHYLSEILQLDSFTQKINAFITKNDLHWVDEVADEITKKDFLYYWIDGFNNTVNTYNYENNLSQVLLFKTFKINEKPYVLLQIHGGADIRGGYTTTKCFKLKGYLTGLVDIYDTIDCIEVSNMYNGYSITNDETNEAVDLYEAKDINLDFCIIEACGVY